MSGRARTSKAVGPDGGPAVLGLFWVQAQVDDRHAEAQGHPGGHREPGQVYKGLALAPALSRCQTTRRLPDQSQTESLSPKKEACGKEQITSKQSKSKYFGVCFPQKELARRGQKQQRGHDLNGMVGRGQRSQSIWIRQLVDDAHATDDNLVDCKVEQPLK